MDWLRRNWPDLLIGVALIAVIAGIIATLISGGSFFPVRDRTAEVPRSTTPLTSSQTPGQSAGQSQQSTSQPQAATPSVVAEPPAVAVDPGGQAEAPQSGEPATPADQGAGQPSVEVTPRETPAAQALPPEPSAAQPSAAAQQQGAVQQSVVQESAAASTPSQAASQVASSPLPQASASSEAPYRVSVGAFSNPDNARRQLEAVRAAGFPAFIGTQGDLNIVLVGPFDTEEEARRVAARIASSDLGVPDPTVYRLQTDDQAAAAPSSQVSATPAAPAAAQPAADQPAPAQPAAQAPAASGAAPTSALRYLQVGAYASRDSSLPQRQRLEAMGFVVTDRVENGLIKLLVGPFDASELASAQARLQSAGIESFPR